MSLFEEHRVDVKKPKIAQRILKNFYKLFFKIKINEFWRILNRKIQILELCLDEAWELFSISKKTTYSKSWNFKKRQGRWHI